MGAERSEFIHDILGVKNRNPWIHMLPSCLRQWPLFQRGEQIRNAEKSKP